MHAPSDFAKLRTDVLKDSKMCQAYEAEKNSIIAAEESQTIRGFVAARLGKPKEANPNNAYLPYFQDYKKAWDHGWDCYNDKEPILPWALESVSGKTVNERMVAAEYFKVTKQLTTRLEEIISSYV